MANRFEPDMNATKMRLLGNGWIALASRLMSIAGGVIAFFAALLLNDIRDDLKSLRLGMSTINVQIGQHEIRLSEIDRRNAEQDRMIERNRDRIEKQN